MKKIISILFAFCVAFDVLADNYKILQMNTTSIKIGEQLCKVGDVFSDESEIQWDDSKQAIKAQNLMTKEIRLFVSQDFKAKNSKTIKEYYLNTAHLSTRGSIIALSDLAESLPDTLYLCDTISIESPVGMNSDYYYFIKCKANDLIMDKPLKFEKRNIIIDKSLFGDSLNSEDVLVSLFFKLRGENVLVKDSLRIELIPWN